MPPFPLCSYRPGAIVAGDSVPPLCLSLASEAVHESAPSTLKMPPFIKAQYMPGTVTSVLQLVMLPPL